ncbi:hypothetical protein HN51_023611 [Arachis hypogaea]|uniref:Uncharacterized protein n=3 Tax=Arachis TaxID=3817 RepID=A0A445C2W4_ARAHY|nr:early nodulin-20 [Arachis duranensis]XP_025608334.1 early nodulin-20-like [Arachis hypogaea]QHO26511.1 hypothetical protein DS421_7g200180 [Arachis hypogaea]RYR45275.1 hypothetical protein Ahy_A07g031112 [Arachis hypogaea]
MAPPTNRKNLDTIEVKKPPRLNMDNNVHDLKNKKSPLPLQMPSPSPSPLGQSPLPSPSRLGQSPLPSPSPLGQTPVPATTKSSSGKFECLCSPTTHAGSFRCRHHRAKEAEMRRAMSVDSNLSALGSKKITNPIV